MQLTVQLQESLPGARLGAVAAIDQDLVMPVDAARVVLPSLDLGMDCRVQALPLSD